MIERHRYLKAASADTVIWHYMSVPHFLYLLNRSSLYFSRVDSLEDKAEVLVSDVERHYWRTLRKTDLDPWIKRERKRVFINCWIKSESENSTMWSAYASQGTGVAIKTTVNRLMASYQGDKQIVVLDVNYIDHREQTVQPKGEVVNVLRFFSAKRVFYKDERELRLVFVSSTENEFDSVQIPVDINVLVEELHTGPNIGDDMFDMVQTMVRAKRCSFPVKHSEMLYPNG